MLVCICHAHHQRLSVQIFLTQHGQRMYVSRCRYIVMYLLDHTGPKLSTYRPRAGDVSNVCLACHCLFSPEVGEAVRLTVRGPENLLLKPSANLVAMSCQSALKSTGLSSLSWQSMRTFTALAAFASPEAARFPMRAWTV